jgi:hypothetical protein
MLGTDPSGWRLPPPARTQGVTSALLGEYRKSQEPSSGRSTKYRIQSHKIGIIWHPRLFSHSNPSPPVPAAEVCRNENLENSEKFPSSGMSMEYLSHLPHLEAKIKLKWSGAGETTPQRPRTVK